VIQVPERSLVFFVLSSSKGGEAWRSRRTTVGKAPFDYTAKIAAPLREDKIIL